MSCLLKLARGCISWLKEYSCLACIKMAPCHTHAFTIFPRLCKDVHFGQAIGNVSKEDSRKSTAYCCVPWALPQEVLWRYGALLHSRAWQVDRPRGQWPLNVVGVRAVQSTSMYLCLSCLCVTVVNVSFLNISSIGIIILLNIFCLYIHCIMCILYISSDNKAGILLYCGCDICSHGVSLDVVPSCHFLEWYKKLQFYWKIEVESYMDKCIITAGDNVNCSIMCMLLYNMLGLQNGTCIIWIDHTTLVVSYSSNLTVRNTPLQVIIQYTPEGEKKA